MKLNREIIAIVTSLLLLAALVVNWGYNVYQNKITALQAESNIIFFEALEAAKETMYTRQNLKPRLVEDKNGNLKWQFDNVDRTLAKWTKDSVSMIIDTKDAEFSEHFKLNGIDFHGFKADSFEVNPQDVRFKTNDVTYSEIKIDSDVSESLEESSLLEDFQALKNSKDSLLLKMNDEEMLSTLFVDLFSGATDSFPESRNISNMSITMTDEGGEIHMNSDTIFIVDFDTTQTYLEKIFLEKMDTAALGQLSIHVFEVENEEIEEIKSSFTTNPGKLGDVFFGRKTYAATIQNFAPIALQKMIPEMLFGLFLYGLIAGAFVIIYRSLAAQRRLVKIKDEFVGNITHELKTPISVVNVAIEAIQKFDADKDPEKTKRYLDISKKELNRLSGLVDKVLHLSINPSEDAPTEPVDIIQLTSQVVDSMQVRLSDSEISMDLNVPDEHIMLDANSSQIKSVIYNLIDNAIKYSDKGKIQITIERNSRGQMEIKIADQGMGISKDFQDRIFDQFFRVPSDNVHNVKGYGLGLHNVKQIVEQYDGQITLKSEENVGTTFIIKWPITNG